MIGFKQFILISLFLIVNIGLFAQSNLVTIQQAVDSAFINNAELNQMRAQLIEKENIWRTKMGISSPEFIYFKEGISSDPASPYAEKRLAVSQEIDFPLTTLYRQKAIKHEVQAKQFQIISKEIEIKTKVKSKYIEVLFALHLQQLRKEQLKLVEDLHKAVYIRFESGIGNGIDLTNAEIQLEEAKNDLDQSEWILHQARYGLFYEIGIPVDQQKYTIEFADTLQTIHLDISQIFLLAKNEEQPDYQASVQRLSASNYFLKEAKSNILPDINFSMYTQDYGSGYNFNGFEIGLSIPIWLPFEQKGKIQIAEARKSEIMWQQKEIKLKMKKQIEYAWHNYTVSRSIVNRYNETLKQKAQKLQSLSLRAYQLGEIDLLNLLNAQQTYIKSEQRYITALRDYYLQLVALEQFIEKDLVF